MIFETYYWRLELGRLARVLRRHMKQRRWRIASDASVEKCIMLGFYSVRKLLEAFQPPPNMVLQLTVTTFPRNRKKLSPICWPEVAEAFDLDAPGTETIDLLYLCNQVIHSYFFSIWLAPDHALRGVFFSSDRYKDKKIYRMDISTTVALFEQIADSRHKFASLAHFYPDHNRVVM
jgi:hypothetical protein